MRVLIVHNFVKHTGGEEIYYDTIKKTLSDQCKFTSYTKNNNLIQDTLTTKLSIAKNLFYNKSVKIELEEIIKTVKPDIAHCNNIFPQITPSIYSTFKKHNIPIIQSIHNYKFICPGGILFNESGLCPHTNTISIKKYFTNCYRNSYIANAVFTASLDYHRATKSLQLVDKFIFPSKFTANIYKRYLRIPNEKVSVIQHYVPQHYEKRKKEKFFLFVGRLSWEKGILDLVNVFNDLPEKKLVIIGNGPLKKTVEKQIKSKNITLLGHLSRSEVYKHLFQASFTIIPSKWYEIGPLVLFESLACKTPVIVPKIGVFKETISNKNGFFFKFNDSDDLKKTINEADTISPIKFNANLKSHFNKKLFQNSMLNLYKNTILK